LYYTKSPW